MPFRTVDDEIRANEMRGRKAVKSEKNPSIVDVIEDTVGAFAKTWAKDRPTEKDLEERRRENDAEQR
jgi:hypothetical protein